MLSHENLINKSKDTAEKIVIIGNGIAGLSAADAARKQNSQASVTIISNESHLTYYRIRLCELINNNLEDDSLRMHPMNWYKEKKLDVVLNKNVTMINPVEKYIVLDEKEKIPYTKLIIASGSQSFLPPVPGINKKGIYTLWTIRDVKTMKKQLENLRHAVIVGGGLLGLEAAYHINKSGIQTTIVELLPRLLPNQLDEQGAKIFKNKVNSLGIDVVTGSSIELLTGDEQVEEIKLSNGSTIAASFVLFAAGVRPNLDIVEGTGIKVNKRINVNQFMQTNLDDIYAAGDVAEFEGKWYGLWSTALNQGKVAGTNAAGGRIAYTSEVPPYFLSTMDTKISSLGDIGMDKSAIYETAEFIDEQNYIYQKLFFKNGTLVGSILIGDTASSNRINAAIKSRMSKEDALRANFI